MNLAAGKRVLEVVQMFPVDDRDPHTAGQARPVLRAGVGHDGNRQFRVRRVMMPVW